MARSITQVESQNPLLVELDRILAEAQQYPTRWHIVQDDFDAHALDTTNGWTLTQVGGVGTATYQDTKGGGLAIASGNTTKTNGVNLVEKHEMYSLDSDEFLFIVRATLTNPTAAQVFIGLAEKDDTAIIASSALSDGLIGAGFYMDDASQTANSGSLNFIVKDNTGTDDETEEEDAFEITAGTAFLIGFHKKNGKLQAYVDGEPVFSVPISTNITANLLARAFVCQSNGVSQPVLTLDQQIIAQTR